LLDGPIRDNPRQFCQAAAGASLAVAADGRLYPCGQTLGDARFVLDGAAPLSPPFSLSLSASLAGREDCAACPLAGRCPNDCPSRLFYNQERNRRLVCILYQVLAGVSS
jgi:uncharacterized protein